VHVVVYPRLGRAGAEGYPHGDHLHRGVHRAGARGIYERARNKVGLLKLRAMYKAENWPDWVDQNDDEALCPIVGKPEDIHIVVTGGPGKHSAFIPTFGTSKSVTRKIEPRS